MKRNQVIAIILVLIFLYDAVDYGVMLYHTLTEKLEPGTTRYFPWQNYIYPSTLLIELLGIAQFILSKYQKSALLRLIILYQLFSYFIYQILLVNKGLFIKVHFDFVSLFYDLAACFKIYVLILLQNRLKPKLIENTDGHTYFDQVGKWNRVLHRLIDTAMLALLIGLYLDSFDDLIRSFIRSENYFASLLGSLLNYQEGVYFPFYFLSTLYYLLSEGIFNTSVGKIIMGNMIVDDEAQKPSVGQRIGRTFSRLIPFDAISFFWPRGWHDRLTDTYVVKAAKKD
ncbi:RDD family protein [Pedobacter sp. KR3-3]|uniref:RDD family protein n=1 Tax=Pedobacter albus TaxID=3113905 RepID=A0ABU7IBS7_9SPHI|nr:RDD family protein [Pedobacter sp. KR3-3]MEE1946821.1 RDD family protein [Pedobacter sp. KR3-3]